MEILKIKSVHIMQFIFDTCLNITFAYLLVEFVARIIYYIEKKSVVMSDSVMHDAMCINVIRSSTFYIIWPGKNIKF